MDNDADFALRIVGDQPIDGAESSLRSNIYELKHSQCHLLLIFEKPRLGVLIKYSAIELRDSQSVATFK